ncbi:MAG: enoyl-CoA hydratase [Alphaproteobacteria bacterium]|nr:enoyl-CoA hydratase [Alphaproteobacteria bacterium]
MAVTQPLSAEPQDILLSRVENGIATLTLNRPKQRNALSFALMAALQSALDRLKEDAAVKVIVIEGNGPAFCAGHDLKEIRSDHKEEVFRELFAACSALMTTIVRHPKPVIAKIHGIATAAGCQLVASCDLAVASSEARFATPGVNIGLFCSTPMVALSRAVGRKQAMEMLLTGDMVDAETAKSFGLINRIAAPDTLDSETIALAEQIASKSPLTVKIGKEAFYKQVEMPLEEAYGFASEVMTRNMMTRDAEEGIDAFIEKRTPTWEGR